jgi:hypothetical protein
MRIPARQRLSRQAIRIRRIGHPPIPDSLEVIHNFIELLDVIFGKGYVQGSDVFAETGDPASAGTPQELGHVLGLLLGSAKGNEVVALRDDPREAELAWGTILLGGNLSVHHTSMKGIIGVYEGTYLRLSTNFKFCSWIQHHAIEFH